MALTAPFSNAMRLGQGFNTYTQELRLEEAVKVSIVQANVTTPSQTEEPKSLTLPITPAASVPKSAPGLSKSSPPDSPVVERAIANGLSALQDVFLPTTNGNTVEHEESQKVVPDPETADLGDSANAQKAKKDEATLLNSAEGAALPFFLPKEYDHKSSQSVTYSARSIDNMSDIMDALNISASASIKYGTIHGNASAGFVNENKVLNSQLSYVVTVTVNNNTHAKPAAMEFQPIDELPAEDFTEVYGDAFISGFYEGGEFAAVISIEVEDKSKLKHIKEALDVSLNLGPSPLSVGAGEQFDKVHSQALRDTAMTISVNWSGGGEVKKPGVAWTLQSVIQVANAFPTMVAQCPAKISAILTRYTSLRSFQVFRYKQMKIEKELESIEKKEELEKESKEQGAQPAQPAKGKVYKTRQRLWSSKNLILNYAPCSIYTADLWDAYMEYKRLWKRIDYIMSDMTRWRVRDMPKISVDTSSQITIQDHAVSKAFTSTTQTAESGLRQLEKVKTSSTPTSPLAHGISASDIISPTLYVDKELIRAETFEIDDPYIVPAFDLTVNNSTRDPIPVEATALNEARLLCREAMTLITEEAARLVNHPELAYAHFDESTKRTKMKRPNYAYPENLKARLPVFIHNDAKDDYFSNDQVVKKLMYYKRDRDLFARVIGPSPNPHRSQVPFTSLDMNEEKSDDNPIVGLSLHSYHHSVLHSKFSRSAENAIGGIGFRFQQDPPSNDGKEPEDGCTVREGASNFQARKFVKLPAVGLSKNPIQISKIIVSYLPEPGYIAGLEFYDGNSPLPCLAWKQWGMQREEPSGLITETQQPPQEGNWTFIGLTGYWDVSVTKSRVLSRISGIWKKE